MFKNKFVIVGLIAVVTIALGLITFVSWQQRLAVGSVKKVTLEWWGVWEQPEVMKKLIDTYHQSHPLVSIRYSGFRPEEYQEKLLKAWAVDQGPDIFMIPNTWMNEYANQYLAPMPAEMQVPAREVRGTIRKQTVDVIQKYAGYTTKDIRDRFLDVVYKDGIIGDRVYGLPFSVDTMVLYYNRALLQANGIAEPAHDWTELLRQAQQISQINDQDELIQSAIAMGTTNNVPNAFDIISLLMLQNGITPGTTSGATFANDNRTADVLSFYQAFARNDTTAYSWNEKQGNALDVFTSGRLAYFLGYNYHAPLIAKSNPKLDYDIIPVPTNQGATKEVAYANYWMNVVAKKSKNKSVAWQAIWELTQGNPVKTYLTDTGKTTALRSLVREQQENQRLAPFAKNLLQAESWYHGYDYPLAQQYLYDMMAAIAAADSPKAIDNEIKKGQNQINQTYKPQQLLPN